MEPIEGVTPTMLWNFGYTMLGLIAVLVCIEKVPDIIWKWKDRKTKAQEGPQANFAEEISENTMHKLEPRFHEIDKKLSADKARLDSHEHALNGVRKTQADIQEGFSALCYAMIAVLNHGIHDGNKDEMENALGKLHEYLSRRGVDRD